MLKEREATIMGGGLAGLTAAILLAQAGKDVLVIEKNHYPFHRVCGEYISNEVLPFLKRIGADPDILNPARLTKFELSAPSGKLLKMPLDVGGFGVSRHSFDHFLYQRASELGVEFMQNTKAFDVQYATDHFSVDISVPEPIRAKAVIGCFGKRSNLDRQLNRPWIGKRSPYLGVKYHILMDYPKDVIALHNFQGGYCGISAIEYDKFCLCYLIERKHLKRHGNIEEMEKQVLYRNPHLKEIFLNAQFLFSRPEVINEVAFDKKAPVENHMLMAGDAAGMIAPLCGNGMSMAIRSGKIAAEAVIGFLDGTTDRSEMVNGYQQQWNALFSRQLKTGRQIQKLFGRNFISGMAVTVGRLIPPLPRWAMRQTHGSAF